MKCKVDNCIKKSTRHGYCTMHYHRLVRHGDVNYINRIIIHSDKCSISNCKNKYSKKGYCNKHYQRFKKYGDPLFTKVNREHDDHCSVEGCNNIFYSKGHCYEHYIKLDRISSNIYLIKREEVVELKKKALKILGDFCICCKVKEWWNLTFDHIKPILRETRLSLRSICIYIIQNPEEAKMKLQT
ncbi:MAG: hypothetical protein KGI05_09595, partial [Thaumarchaeota archaeon]|nr:hypothetical protein [Nitrososphaerota archaeon]